MPYVITDLLKHHNFDPTDPGQLLIIQHVDTTDTYRLGPLVVISSDKGYLISRADVRGRSDKAIRLKCHLQPDRPALSPTPGPRRYASRTGGSQRLFLRP